MQAQKIFKNLKKHGFNFLQAQKISKNMDIIFYKLRVAQKHGNWILCKVKTAQKPWIWFSSSLKKTKKISISLFLLQAALKSLENMDLFLSNCELF